MDGIDRDTLLRLSERNEFPSVTLYQPVDHFGIHTDADRIRLRNLVRKAHERLLADGVRETDAEDMLGGVLNAASSDSAWSGGPSGLAVFATPEGFETLWVDRTMPELAVVGDRFYLRPLFAALQHEGRAWALAIDSNKTRLFHLDRVSVEEVPLPEGTPTSLAEVSRYDQGEESLQYHTLPGATGPSGGQPAAMFHGHGGEKDADKIARQQFMIALARGVTETIGAQSAQPLVLLGVDYLLDDFHAASNYSHIADERVEGATDYLSAADIQRKALAVLAPRAAASAAADLDEYRSLAGTGHSSNVADEIVAAAANGRVKTLIIDDTFGPWGYFDRATREVTHLCPAVPRYWRDTMEAPADVDVQECGWDLVDLAAVETLRHGGAVRAYQGEAAPIKGAAAIYRY